MKQLLSDYSKMQEEIEELKKENVKLKKLEEYDKDSKNMDEMELHEMIEIEHWGITRVPGGWVYFDKRVHVAIFVPFNNEFIVKEK